MLSVEGEVAGLLPWLKGSRNAHFGIRTTLTAWGSVSLRCIHYFDAKYKATLQQICHGKSEHRVLGATTQAAFDPRTPRPGLGQGSPGKGLPSAPWLLKENRLLLVGWLLFWATPGAKMQCFSTCRQQRPLQTEVLGYWYGEAKRWESLVQYSNYFVQNV